MPFTFSNMSLFTLSPLAVLVLQQCWCCKGDIFNMLDKIIQPLLALDIRCFPKNIIKKSWQLRTPVPPLEQAENLCYNTSMHYFNNFHHATYGGGGVCLQHQTAGQLANFGPRSGGEETHMRYSHSLRFSWQGRPWSRSNRCWSGSEQERVKEVPLRHKLSTGRQYLIEKTTPSGKTGSLLI